MPNLNALSAFATARRHNLTGPLSHEQVVALATAWVPHIHFHERERFHPLGLVDLVSIPNAVFSSLPNSAKDAFRIAVTGDLGTEVFDPPVVRVPHGPGSRVLASGASAADAFDDLELGHHGTFTYGANLGAARTFFGATTTVSGAAEPTEEDPRRPANLPIVVHVELRMLLETLKHELELDLPEAPDDSDGRIDAIWPGFSVEGSFFRPGVLMPSSFSRSDRREILKDLVAAHEANDQAAEAAALSAIPSDYVFVTRAWDVVKTFAFLEFYLAYPFNDYKEYGTWPFENEHEGDIEGCCVVFERRFLDRLAAGTELAENIIPHTVITSVHEEFNGSDRMKRLPVVRDRARDDLTVFVAAGSHATYLTAGRHDILDFEDVLVDLPAQLPTPLMVLGYAAGILNVLALAVGIVEYLVDSEDETSGNGVTIGPGPADPASLLFEKRLEVTPLSNIETGTNIYQNPAGDALALRAYPGKWGGDDGVINKSGGWENKTGRFFRRFLRGNVEPAVIVD